VDPLLLVRPEGLARGGFTVHTGPRIVEFNAESSIHPQSLTRMIGILTNRFWESVRFTQPFRVVGQGRVDYGRETDTDFSLDCECGAIGVWRFVARNSTFRTSMKGRTTSISELTGDLCDGRLSADIEFVPAGPPTNHTRYAAEGRLESAGFENFVQCLRGRERADSAGTLSGNFDISGLTGTNAVDSLRGRGYIRVKNGRVFMLPVFGGLTTYLSKRIPGMNFVLSQTEAGSEFVIADSKAHTDKIQISGDVLTLRGNGDYHLDRRLDFKAELLFLKPKTFAHKIFRLPTYLFSKLFEFRLYGTLDDPRWRPVNFTEDVWQGAEEGRIEKSAE
jgi:hypothetical protein